jgi:hypothetical protein
LDTDRGYVLEVDIVIPDSVHNKLDELPLAPEAKCPPDSKVKKLLLTHEPKFNYVVHARLLQLYVKLGAVISKVHRIVGFTQKPVFASYIGHNTRQRALATDSFAKNFYKLKSNSLYGKLVENVKKRINVRLCNSSKKLVTYCSKAKFRRSSKIDKDLVAVLLGKDEVELNRPSYQGQVVLDLSKLLMYELQYIHLERYRQMFGCQIHIVAGDTDSFFLECNNVDLRSQLLPQMIADGLLDTSNYDPSDPLYSRQFASQIGLFKDESMGKTYQEWIFLGPKCYSLKGTTVSLRAKGVHLRGTVIGHEHYQRVYRERSTVSVPQQRIGTVNHQLYTMRSEKRALQCHDNKRYWTGPNSSLAYGHHLLSRDNG